MLASVDLFQYSRAVQGAFPQIVGPTHHSIKPPLKQRHRHARIDCRGLILPPDYQGHEIVVTQEAFWLLVVAGIAAVGVDIFALLAYERGLRVIVSLNHG